MSSGRATGRTAEAPLGGLRSRDAAERIEDSIISASTSRWLEEADAAGMGKIGEDILSDGMKVKACLSRALRRRQR